MKTSLSIILLTIFCNAVQGQSLDQSQNDQFHEPIQANVKLLSVDTVNFEYYFLWRFQFVEDSQKYGKLIVPKSEKSDYKENSIHTFTLCDPKKFILVFNSKKATSLNNEIINSDDSITELDTMHFHGPPLLNATISDEGILLLDFGNSAKEQVFEICK